MPPALEMQLLLLVAMILLLPPVISPAPLLPGFTGSLDGEKAAGKEMITQNMTCSVSSDCQENQYCHLTSITSECKECKPKEKECIEDEECCLGQACIEGRCDEGSNISGSWMRCDPSKDRCPPGSCCSKTEAIQFPVCIPLLGEGEQCISQTINILELLNLSSALEPVAGNCHCGEGLVCLNKGSSKVTKMSADFFEGDGRMDIVISHGADESPVHAEEQMLDWIFQVFDSEGRGKVSVLQIMERLKSITDPSRDGDKLQCLCEMLDPEDQGTLIDLETFRRIMTEWIASCCQDGEFEGKTSSDDRSVKDFPQVSAEKLLHNDAQLVGYGGDDQKCLRENADLISKITELNFDNKNLTEEKGKLQRSLELSDEMNAHLTEEISTLKNKLKSFQQTVQHAQSVSSELEDIKTLVRDLEDKVGALCFEKKQLDKENMSLHKQVQALQEGNEKWLHDKEQAKEKVNELRSANSRIMVHRSASLQYVIQGMLQ